MINTCTVTEEADQDALRLVRKIARRNPVAKLVVTGCLASRSPGEILAAAPGALVVGNDGKDALPALLGCSPTGAFPGITEFHNHTRAFVKVQDGCNMHCAYCIIPSIRPKLQCKPYEELEKEVKGLIERGVQEIVLCGVRLGRYMAVDRSGRRVDFVAMVGRLLELPGDFRIRLSSFEVTDLTDRFLERFAGWTPKLCPSFHVPLQAGTDKILKKMERWYSTRFYAERIAAVRAVCRDAGLFTDVMVGFPGETAADFERSLEFVKQQGFSGLHVFRFSKRSGTPAARMKDQVPEKELMDRSRRMRALDLELRTAFAAASVGTTRRILVEQPGVGMTEHFLKAAFDEGPSKGLFEAEIVSSDGPHARAVPQRVRR